MARANNQQLENSPNLDNLWEILLLDIISGRIYSKDYELFRQELLEKIQRSRC